MRSIHCRLYTSRRREENPCRCVSGPSIEGCTLQNEMFRSMWIPSRGFNSAPSCTMWHILLAFSIMPVLLKMQFSGETCPLSRRFVTLNAWLRSLDSSFGICGAQSGTGQVVFPTLMPFSVHNYSASAVYSFFCHPGNDQWAHLGYICVRF